MTQTARSLNSVEIAALLDNMAETIAQDHQNNLQSCLLFGLETGGVWIAQALHERLGLSSELGIINVHFHRDDFGQRGLHPSVGASHVPEPVDEQNIILVDDILYTGRTIKAALHEIFDYGRPASVKLAVLIDRGGRELPIQPDYYGARWQVDAKQNLNLKGPAELNLNLVENPVETPA